MPARPPTKSLNQPPALTSAQIRAARALIRWSAEDLARECALGIATIRRAELRDSATKLTAANDLAVRHALEAAGVEFIDESEKAGAGVRLGKPQLRLGEKE
jgi:transcriptional regulator with XRE-family HTH domain